VPEGPAFAAAVTSTATLAEAPAASVALDGDGVVQAAITAPEHVRVKVTTPDAVPVFRTVNVAVRAAFGTKIGAVPVTLKAIVPGLDGSAVISCVTAVALNVWPAVFK